MSSLRLGILGGTFDPPHLGHLALATTAYQTLSLDRLHVIPAAQAPLREGPPLAPAAERLLLLRLAFDALPWAVVDDRELRRGGLSYSVDTARELVADYPGATLYWILGADQLARLHLWHQVHELCQCVHFAVYARKGQVGAVDPSLAGVARVTWLAAPEVDCSSTAIRAGLSQGQAMSKSLPPAVSAAIEARGLYR